MLKVYTYWSRHYNEVIIVVAFSREEAFVKLHDVYMPGCEIDDWIIGSVIDCKEGETVSINIPKK